MNCKYLNGDTCKIKNSPAPCWCVEANGDCRSNCYLHSDRQMNNRQKLNAMGNEEFAGTIIGLVYEKTKDEIIEWLETPIGL